MLRRLLCLWIIVNFLTTLIAPEQRVFADESLGLPMPGTMVNLSPTYEPVLMKGLKVHPENPFLFDFIIDTGHSNFKAQDLQLKTESKKLIKYFLASLTVPDKDLWVNLSPYEKDRIIAPNLGQTEMGRDMLAQDYILKQLTASLIYPEKHLGKTFWDEVYAKSREMYGTTQIPVNTFNKVWIVADMADVFERGNVAYVVGAHLKVMLEEDYLAMDKHTGVLASSQSHTIASQIIRKIILPQIEKEVNTGRNFAPLRQMFYSMILSSWYKMVLKDAILTRIYGNQSKVKVGINQQDPKTNETIFKRYLQAYKKGVFNYIKEDIHETGAPSMPRKYFSGGDSFEMVSRILRRDRAMPADISFTNDVIETVGFTPAKASRAMTALTGKHVLIIGDEPIAKGKKNISEILEGQGAVVTAKIQKLGADVIIKNELEAMPLLRDGDIDYDLIIWNRDKWDEPAASQFVSGVKRTGSINARIVFRIGKEFIDWQDNVYNTTEGRTIMLKSMVWKDSLSHILGLFSQKTAGAVFSGHPTQNSGPSAASNENNRQRAIRILSGQTILVVSDDQNVREQIAGYFQRLDDKVKVIGVESKAALKMVQGKRVGGVFIDTFPTTAMGKKLIIDIRNINAKIPMVLYVSDKNNFEMIVARRNNYGLSKRGLNSLGNGEPIIDPMVKEFINARPELDRESASVNGAAINRNGSHDAHQTHGLKYQMMTYKELIRKVDSLGVRYPNFKSKMKVLKDGSLDLTSVDNNGGAFILRSVSKIESEDGGKSLIVITLPQGEGEFEESQKFNFTVPVPASLMKKAGIDDVTRNALIRGMRLSLVGILVPGEEDDMDLKLFGRFRRFPDGFLVAYGMKRTQENVARFEESLKKLAAKATFHEDRAMTIFPTHEPVEVVERYRWRDGVRFDDRMKFRLSMIRNFEIRGNFAIQKLQEGNIRADKDGIMITTPSMGGFTVNHIVRLGLQAYVADKSRLTLSGPVSKDGFNRVFESGMPAVINTVVDSLESFQSILGNPQLVVMENGKVTEEFPYDAQWRSNHRIKNLDKLNPYFMLSFKNGLRISLDVNGPINLLDVQGTGKLQDFLYEVYNLVAQSFSEAMTARTDNAIRGGIDLSRSKMDVRKEDGDVQMQFDPAMIERIKRDGFDGIDFEIEKIIPLSNMSSFLELSLSK